MAASSGAGPPRTIGEDPEPWVRYIPDVALREAYGKIAPMTQLEMTAGAREGTPDAPGTAGATEPSRSAPAAQARRPPLRRSRRNRIIAGVAGGVAEHLGFDPLPVRLAFAALAVTGFGIVVYLLLWALAPLEPRDAVSADMTGTSARDVAAFRRPALRQLIGGGLLIGGVFIAFSYEGISINEGVWIPLTLAALGFAVLWARGSAEEGRPRLDLSGI